MCKHANGGGWLRAILLMIAVVVGCGDTPLTSPAEEQQNAAQARVAVVVSTLDNPWFVVLADAAVSRLEELGMSATIFDSQNDPAIEASHFDNVVSAGYAAILLNATDSEGSIASVRKARAAGLPVFCIDREINAEDAATAQILSDNYAGCVELAQHFVAVVGTEGKYAELLGILGDNNTTSRSDGFHSVVDRFDSLQMVAQQSADFDRTKALEVMESILQNHRDLDAVFCGNDAMAMGAYQAIASAGLTEQVAVFGFDGAADVIASIRQGRINATGMQFPKLMARRAAEFASEWLEGRREFPQKIPVEVELVTQQNVDSYAAYGAKE